MSKRDELKLSSPRKRKMKEISDDDVDEVDAEEVVKKVPAKKQATSSTKAEKGSIKKPASKAETKAETKTAETKATEKIAETKAETKAEIKAEQNQGEPHEEGEVKKKNNFWQLKNRAPPQALGSKEIPQGAPNCLIGLTFVFTGEMESISRDEAQDLVKRYGGKVTTAVSGRTSYLVVGRDVGESKLKKAKEVKTTIVDEDGFFDLIRTSKEKSDDYASASATKGKGKAKESEKIEKLAAKIETTSHTLSQLWTDKYKPEKLGDVCGNKTLVQKIANWLRNWQANNLLWENNLAEGFKRSGADDTGIYRSVLISGPPGIGKTTSAHLCARMEGYEVLEFNASDVRSKRIVEVCIYLFSFRQPVTKRVESLTDLIDNRTMTEFFKSGKSVDTGEKSELTDKLGSGKKVVLIMDEVDGMSAGDRGGSVELAKLIKNTKIPIICICMANDHDYLYMCNLTFDDCQLHSWCVFTFPINLLAICPREGLKLGGNVVDELVASTQSDIRQIINMLSTYRISHNTISYDEGKNLAKMNEKYIQLNIFQICERLLTAKSWRSMQLSEKLELYFHEYQLANLMIQENYPKINPALAREGLSSGQNEIDCRTMDLLSKAADAISDGDLVDRMIHGTEQQWSLMPVHSAFSCVRPAYFMHGFSSGLEGRYNFPGWLGQNSKATKYQRLLRDVQIHMRLSISGDKNEVRQTYLPTLTSSLGLPIIKEQYDDGIRIMDEYYLSREDFDTIMELELAIKGKQPLLKRLNGTTKTSFTRKYNGANHPTPFMKATTTTSKKLGATIEIPDLEDAFVDDEVLAGGDASQEEDDGKEDGLEKDNMIKEKKVKGSGKASGSSATPKSKSKETPVKAKSSAGSGSRAKASTSKGKK
ncbi:hypothetical protein BC937DRAFT_93313 [Endogone sp. FLAS-F59071]|nr:hypothetical protein BC937DRAFT_93313 [Endogone sp. FLAS-F59071]|eukprot:RUS23369.1 hypothetical protein BC937DRAFT_93313 [Endogone sp. FLAS-F59071]